MSSIGSLVVRIGADISGLRSDANKAASTLDGLKSASDGVSGALKAIGVAWAASKLAELAKGALEAVDAQAKLARQLGGTVTGLKGLQLAAEDLGVDSGTLGTAMEKLNVRLAEAARTGAGPAHDALQRLGLSARQLAEADTDERMALIADRMQDMGLSAQGTADTLAQLGIRQTEITRMMLDGGDVIRAATDEIEEMGLALSQVDAAKVEAANDAMMRVRMAVEGIGQQLAVHLAPVLKAISDRIVALAKDTGGFKDAVDTTVSFSVKAIGFLGDAIRGIHLVFKAVELAGWAFGLSVVHIVETTAQVITTLIDGVIAGINSMVNAVNTAVGRVLVQPIDFNAGQSGFMKAMEEFAGGVRLTVEGIVDEMRVLATSEWPSDKAAKFFAEVQAAAQAAAQETVAAQQTMRGVALGDEGGSEAEDKGAAKLREKLAQQLVVLQEHVLSEEELLQARHVTRLEQLAQALDAELVTLDQYRALESDLERKHMQEMGKIREKGMDRLQDISVSSVFSSVQQLSGLFSQLTGAAAEHNRDMFDAHKGFAIADALISGAAGIAQTLGAYPYPYNLAMAIPHAAVAAAQVATIASQSFNGGGSVRAPSAGGGGGARMGGFSSGGGSPGGGGGGLVGGNAGPSQLASINLQGDMFSRNTVIGLIDQINELTGDGVRLVVSS